MSKIAIPELVYLLLGALSQKSSIPRHVPHPRNGSRRQIHHVVPVVAERRQFRRVGDVERLTAENDVDSSVVMVFNHPAIRGVLLDVTERTRADVPDLRPYQA